MDKSVRDPRLTDVDIHDFLSMMRSMMVVYSRGINGVVIHGQVTCTDVKGNRRFWSFSRVDTGSEINDRCSRSCSS